MIDMASSSDQAILERLKRHPRVSKVEQGVSPGITFHVGSWIREVRIGDYSCPLFGLVEVMDNNPLVCADSVSVPTCVATVALIALSPVVQAGLLEESPVMIVSEEADEAELNVALNQVGWLGGMTVHTESMDLKGVVAATVMAEVSLTAEFEEIQALYTERFERSFFVQNDQGSIWDASLVSGKPFALYRLGFAPDNPTSMLTIRVIADIQGKCGADQAIHAMNVMCGLEESLGIGLVH